MLLLLVELRLSRVTCYLYASAVHQQSETIHSLHSGTGTSSSTMYTKFTSNSDRSSISISLPHTADGCNSQGLARVNLLPSSCVLFVDETRANHWAFMV
ncbi:hypothetical protein NPIL_556761 [Nephila pilipes]|uniref:Secreted protein n=1 Tax=Nephila pilipes TaxID=299642 RepID=A0A8X6PZN5_NEPPI|nr:hypothetical protein NPIL_556761 [Nephila pilipes]